MTSLISPHNAQALSGKAAGGLLRATIEVKDDHLASVSLSGNFFCHPQDAVSELAASQAAVAQPGLGQLFTLANAGIELGRLGGIDGATRLLGQGTEAPENRWVFCSRLFRRLAGQAPALFPPLMVETAETEDTQGPTVQDVGFSGPFVQ